MVDISQLQTDADASVNGKWKSLPGFDGVRVRLAHFRLPVWLDWLETTRDEFDDEEDRERAFYGAKIVRDVEGLEERGKPVDWTEETAKRLMTQCQEVIDERTGKAVKVYALDSFYFWVKHFANDPSNYATTLAGN